jgi:A/G-specific adenine glycosylase
MLQQTQVDRVIPKYKSFLKKFPNSKALGQAPLAEVLKEWQGLGYNRRAKYLWEAAKQMKGKYVLEDLPGVGPYTANAVRVFAYNEPRVLIETNIRAVFLHHMFPKSKKVTDARLLLFIAAAVPPAKAREWYSALMDYGSYLKSITPNPSRRSKHHTKQSKFKGSDREIRGAILRATLAGESLKKLPFDKKRIKIQVTALKKEGLI